jgi:predicted alpha/beta-fold hydrolase
MPTTNPARRPPATSGYVPANGLDLYYEIHGDGSPLALFHGAMGTIDSCFADLLPALAATRKVVAVELQGHGHTADTDRPLSYRHMAADAAVLLEALGIGTADLVGYSLGGGVVGDLAGLPASQLAILPGTSHVGVLGRVDWLQSMILEFLGSPEPRPL